MYKQSDIRIMKRFGSLCLGDSLYEFLVHLKEGEVRTFCFYGHSERLPYIVTIKYLDHKYIFSISFDNIEIGNNKPYETTKGKDDFESKLKGAIMSCGFTSYKSKEIDEPLAHFNSGKYETLTW